MSNRRYDSRLHEQALAGQEVLAIQKRHFEFGMINYDQYIYMDTYGAWCEPLRGEDVAPPWQLKEEKSDQTSDWTTGVC